MTGSYTGTGLYGGGASTGGGFGSFLVAGPGSASCSGTITATFTWNNEGDEGNLPPQTVIIREDSTAEWGGDSGSASNGLGHSAVNQTYSGVSTGTKWSYRQDPGTEFQVTVTPSASASFSSNSSSGLLAGACNVEYVAHSYIARLTFTGTIPGDPIERILIGQELEAELVLGLDEQLLSESDTFSWDISGGSPFTSYEADEDGAELNEWESPVNALFTTCHFGKAQNSVAVSVTAYIHDIDLEFTVSRSVKPEPPDPLSFTVLAGDPELMNGPDPDLNDPNTLRLWWAVNHQSEVEGAWFRGTITTPIDYVDGEDGGEWCLVQLVTSIQATYYANGEIYDSSANFSGDVYLDALYPYRGEWFDGDDIERERPGSPALPFPDPDLTLIHYAVSFEVYVLYLPPREGSQPVPVRKWTWSFTGTGEIGNPWTVTGSSLAEEVTGTPSHPIWIKNTAALAPISWIKR